MKKTAILFLLLLLISSVYALDLPRPTSFVNDFADMITSNEETTLVNLIAKIEREQTVEIAIVTIESLQGEPIESVTLQIGREWGVGKKQNGLVILVSKKDREWRIETGKALEGSIPDVITSNLGRKVMTPYFKAGDFGQGIYEAILEIEKLLQNDPSVIEKYKPSAFRDFMPLILFATIFLLITFTSYCSNIKKKYKKYTTFFGGEILLAIISFFIAIDFFIMILFFCAFFAIFFTLSSIGYYGKGEGGIYYGGFGGSFSSGGSFGGGFGGFGGGGGFAGGGSSGGW